MPIAYELDPAHNLIVYRASGTVIPQDALGSIDRIVLDTGGKAMGMDVLFLVDPAASLSAIDVHAIKLIKEKIEGWLKRYPRAPIKCAIVSPPPKDLVGELWRATTDIYPAMAEHTRTFKSISEAYAWLRS